MKTFLVAFLIVMVAVGANAQTDEGDLARFEQQVDHAVVACDLQFLENAYAADFRFKHGTGLVDSKTSWLKSVGLAKGKFISREIDSLEVEIHGTIGITSGRLSVHRYVDSGESRYIINYVRVYVRKGGHWQMIMHRTVRETHLH
jgi:hypothetical protein